MNAELAIFCVIVLLANMVGATTGFGGSMITVTLAVHLYPIEFLVPIVVLLNLVISIYIVIRHHSGIDGKLLLKQILPFAAIGLPIGIILFNVVKSGSLKLALGAFVICFSAFELVVLFRSGKEELRKPLSPVHSAFWLFTGGVMQGMYASGGPLVVYYAGRNIPDKRVFRSTLSALWLVLNTVLLITYLATGKLTSKAAWYFVVLLPFLAIGIAIGEWVHTALPERTFRILTFSILLLTGISVFI
jgi:uncharacterized membrane protein YfcA